MVFNSIGWSFVLYLLPALLLTIVLIERSLPIFRNEDSKAVSIIRVIFIVMVSIYPLGKFIQSMPQIFPQILRWHMADFGVTWSYGVMILLSQTRPYSYSWPFGLSLFVYFNACLIEYMQMRSGIGDWYDIIAYTLGLISFTIFLLVFKKLEDSAAAKKQAALLLLYFITYRAITVWPNLFRIS